MVHVLEKHSDFCFSKSKLIWHFLISYKSQLWLCFILTTKVCFYIHMHTNYSGFLFWHFEPFFSYKNMWKYLCFQSNPSSRKMILREAVFISYTYSTLLSKILIQGIRKENSLHSKFQSGFNRCLFIEAEVSNC